MNDSWLMISTFSEGSVVLEVFIGLSVDRWVADVFKLKSA
jgi:hypothetical protein